MGLARDFTFIFEVGDTCALHTLAHTIPGQPAPTLSWAQLLADCWMTGTLVGNIFSYKLTLIVFWCFHKSTTNAHEERAFIGNFSEYFTLHSLHYQTWPTCLMVSRRLAWAWPCWWCWCDGVSAPLLPATHSPASDTMARAVPCLWPPLPLPLKHATGHTCNKVRHWRCQQNFTVMFEEGAYKRLFLLEQVDVVNTFICYISPSSLMFPRKILDQNYPADKWTGYWIIFTFSWQAYWT